MLFDNTEFNFENDLFPIPGSDFKEKRNNKFVSAEEGFLRGNLMADLYEPYKGYTYFKLKPENEQEKLLLQLMAYSFAINDLNLYLDLYPNDTETYALFKDYVKEKNRLEERYSEIYGPMSVTMTQQNRFNWIDNPWPWEKNGGSKYV